MRTKNLKSQKTQGVTLIALVITIVILVILAGVTILTLTGENGTLRKSNTAKEETRKQAATEILNLKITNVQVQTYAKEQRMPILKELAISLDPENDSEIQSVTKTRQKTSSLDWVDTDYTSIFTILKDYPEYEFEINSDLKLATINGVEVADNTNISKEDYNALLKRVNDLENALNAQTNTQPTGIRTNTYIKNQIQSSNPYSQVTSKDDFTNTSDSENNIANYLSFSTEDGYTVLKEGWYFIYLASEIVEPTSNSFSLLRFYLGDSQFTNLPCWAERWGD